MSHTVSRRRACMEMAGAVVALVAWPRQSFAQAPAGAITTKPPVMVYKDAACGCCQAWVEHMQANGYKTTVSNNGMAAIKVQHKIPGELQSCHTALVGGYVVEGHVPASDVAKLLAKKPKGILGLTIPGMPASAPGMDGIPFRPYTVLTFDARGKTTVFAKHDKPA